MRPESEARGSPHLEEHDLAERALSVGRVLECVEYLLERHHLARLLIHRPPHDAISALAQLLYYLVLPQHVPVDLVRPAVVGRWAWGSWQNSQGRPVGGAGPDISTKRLRPTSKSDLAWAERLLVQVELFFSPKFNNSKKKRPAVPL